MIKYPQNISLPLSSLTPTCLPSLLPSSDLCHHHSDGQEQTRGLSTRPGLVHPAQFSRHPCVQVSNRNYRSLSFLWCSFFFIHSVSRSCVLPVTSPPQQADPRPQVLRGEWQYVWLPGDTQKGHEMSPVCLQVHHTITSAFCRVSPEITFVGYHQYS